MTKCVLRGPTRTMEGRQSSCKTVETCKGRFGRWKGDDLARQWELARADSDNGREMILQDGGNLQGPTWMMEGRRSCKTVETCKGRLGRWKEDLARQWPKLGRKTILQDSGNLQGHGGHHCAVYCNMLHERVGLASLSADSDNGRVAISNSLVMTVFCAKWGNGNYSTCCKKQPGSGQCLCNGKSATPLHNMIRFVSDSEHDESAPSQPMVSIASMVIYTLIGM